MTIVAERSFTVTVKMEAPHVTALDEATEQIRNRLENAFIGKPWSIRVISMTVARA